LFVDSQTDPLRRIAFVTATQATPTTSLAPMLSVRRGAQAVAFYKKAFDAEKLFLIEAGDGAVVAQLAIHGAKFWVAGRSASHRVRASGNKRSVVTSGGGHARS
jgi:hypothetical protein